MKIRIPKLTAEQFFGFLLILYWGQNILFNYIKLFFRYIPFVGYFADYIVPGAMFVCLLFSIPYFLKCISYKDILFTGIVVFVVFSNIVLFPENTSLVQNLGTFFVSVFPLYFLGVGFETSKHFRMLYILSVINVWAFSFFFLLGGGNQLQGNEGEYTSFMGRAYMLLPQLLMATHGLLRKRNILNILTCIIGVIVLLMCGNRGSILIWIGFIILSLLFNTGKKRRMSVYLGTACGFGIFAYYYSNMIEVLSSIFSKFGMSIRVFTRLTEGTFFESHGRNVILEKLETAIWEHPIVGHGLCADRTITGSYAHNYAYELWTAFGVIIGTVLLIATVCFIMSALIKTKDTESRGFLLALTSIGFIKLFLSSSFMLEGLFFMLIGYCVRQHRVSKFEKIESGEE